MEKWDFIFECIVINSVRVWNNWTSLQPSSTRQSLGPAPPRPAPRRAVDPPRPTWGPVSLSYSRSKSSVTEKGMGPKLETEQNTRDITLISLLHVVFVTLYLQLFDSCRFINEVWMCSWKIICIWLKIYSVEFFCTGGLIFLQKHEFPLNQVKIVIFGICVIPCQIWFLCFHLLITS